MGTYTHQLLVRGEPRMCRFMVRTKIKNKGSRSSSSNNMFINMSHLKQEQHQSVPIPPTVAASESVQKISTDNSITTLPHHILCDRSQNDSCSAKLAPTSSCAISCEQEEILESTKRLQDLEKKNRKILKLLELRLSLLEMKTVETGNYHSYLQSLSHIDASPSVLDCKNDEDAVNNKHEDHAGVWDLTTELICGGGSNVHICDDTLEDMDHDQFDNIFNDSDLKILPAEFSPFHLEPMVPSDTHGMSNHSHSHTFFPTSDRAVFERKSALYPDVAAELVRIFG